MTPQELKASILQLAIQGKLVEHFENDKAVAIPSSFAGDTSDFFEIPDNWKWLSIRDVASVNTGLSFKKQDQRESSNGSLRVLRGGNIGGDYKYHLYEDDVYVEFEQFQTKYIQLLEGDVITPSVTSIEKICKTGFIDRDLPAVTAGGFVYIIRCLDRAVTEPKYLLYFISSFFNKEQCKPNIHKSGQAFYNLKKTGFIEQPICVPPLAEQKRIVAKIEELLPLIDRYEQVWSKLEDLNKRFPVDMQKSILQMAIQGKLVSQLPEEGTGEELFRQIQAEKQRLIKAGTIKKEKPLPEIAEDEIPFDIPESWKWVRFSDVLDVRDGTHDTPKYVTSGIPLVTSKNLVDGGIDFETTKLISIEDAQAINMRSAVDDGDILFAMIGTIGNPVLVKKDREFCIKNMALFKAINQDLISMEYLLLFLQNEQHVMKKKASGGVQSFVSLKFLRNYLLPLPPAAEQERIVAKLEEILPLCERLK